MSNVKRKAVQSVRIKDATTGEVEAVIATLGVVDKDGDIIVKGAVEEQAVVVSAYGHKSWEGALPVGKGTIKEVGDELVASLRFFLKTTAGADTFETVKELSEDDLQEWSFSLHEVESQRVKVDGYGTASQLDKIGLIKEVSPVLRGAGVNTRTIATKGMKVLNSELSSQLRDAGREAYGGDNAYVYLHDFDADGAYAIFCRYSDTEPETFVQVSYTITDGLATLGDDATEVEPVTTFEPKSSHEGVSFVDEGQSVVAAARQYIKRAGDVVALRTAKGRAPLSADSTKVIEDLVTELKSVLDDLASLTEDGSAVGDEPAADADIEAKAEAARLATAFELDMIERDAREDNR